MLYIFFLNDIQILHTVTVFQLKCYFPSKFSYWNELSFIEKYEMYLVSIILMYTIDSTEIDHMPYSFIEFQWFVVTEKCKRSPHIQSISIFHSGHVKK